MKKKSNNDLRRTKAKKTVRGTPMFDLPIESNKDNSDLIKEPETGMDVARLLADELKKKWPDAQTPSSVSGKHTKFVKDIMNEYQGETIKDMVRILVWDFEEIRKNKSFFPPSSHLNWPWIDQLYHYRHALASAVGSGITDSTSRSSAYAQRYLNQSGKAIEDISQDKPQGDSMKDIAKRLLGQ